MLCFRDKTYCDSKDCPKKCHLFATSDIVNEATQSGLPLSLAYFYVDGECVIGNLEVD